MESKILHIVTCRNDGKESLYYVKENHRCRMLMDCFVKQGNYCNIYDCNLSSFDLCSILYRSVVVFDISESNIRNTINFVAENQSATSEIILWFKSRALYDFAREMLNIEGYVVAIGNDYSEIVSWVTRGRCSGVNFFELRVGNVGRNKDTLSNTYLDSVMLNGGLCEVIAGGQCKKCIECERIDENSIINRTPCDIIDEIRLLRKIYHVRKISILGTNFFADSAMKDSLMNDSISDTRYSICCCYKDLTRNIHKIRELGHLLYNIDLFADIHSKQLEPDILSLHSITRIKLHFHMFTASSTKEDLIEALDFLEKGWCSFAPDCLFIKQGELSESLQKIYIVWKYIFKKIFLAEFIKIVDLENSLKRPFRLGERRDYNNIKSIDELIKRKSNQLNATLFKMLRRVIHNEKSGNSLDTLLKESLFAEIKNIETIVD